MKKSPRPSRKEVRAHQGNIAALDFARELRRMLDAPPAGTSADADLRRMAESYLARAPAMREPVRFAEGLYRSALQRATEECMMGVGRGDYDPLWHNLTLFGPRLLAESQEIAAIVDQWWVAAIDGDREARALYDAALNALRVGRGRYRVRTDEEQRERALARDHEYKTRTRAAKDAFTRAVAVAYQQECRWLARAGRPNFRAAYGRVVTAVAEEFRRSSESAKRRAVRKKRKADAPGDRDARRR
ncbi:MAG TPA: hypothetical protein VKJ47_05935 [Candidatus Binatia bacterium]|nr:hypothetical protein [Candidatus Binatia bacterium]